MRFAAIRKSFSIALLGFLASSAALLTSVASAADSRSGMTSLVVQQAPESIRTLSFTRNAKFVVGKNLLNLVQVWNSSNGQQILKLEPSGPGALTPAGDEQRMFNFVGGEVREINFSHPLQSQVLFNYETEKTSIAVATTDRSDRFLAFGSYKGTIRVLDLSKRLLIFSQTMPAAPKNLVFSSLGNQLIVEDKLGDIHVVDLASGNVTVRKTDTKPLAMRGLALHGQIILSLRKYKDLGWLLWDVNKRMVFKRIECQCNILQLSGDGSSFVWIENQELENSVVRVSSIDGVLPDRHFAFPYADELGLSHDGSRVAVASTKGKLAIWGADSITLGQGGNVDYSRIVGFASGYDLLDVNDETLHIWHTRYATEEALHVGSAPTALSMSGRYLSIFAGKIRVLDLATSQLVTYQASLSDDPEAVSETAVSSDGKAVAWVEKNDEESDLKLARSKDPEAQSICRGDFDEVHLAFSPDSSLLGVFCHSTSPATFTGLGTLKIVQVDSGSVLGENPTSIAVSDLTFTPDNKLCLKSKRKLFLLALSQLGSSDQYSEWATSPSAMAVSPDGIYVAAAMEGVVELRYLKDFQFIRKLPIDEGEMIELAFNNDSLLAAGGWDGAIRLWNFKTGKFLGKVIGFAGHDWLAVSKNGFFDGTAQAMGWVGWHIDGTDELLPLDALFADFFTPGIMFEIMSGSGDDIEVERRYAGLGPFVTDGGETPDKPPEVGLRIPGLGALIADGKASIQHPNGKVVLCLRFAPTTFFPYYFDGQFNSWTGNEPPPDVTVTDCPYPRILPAEPEVTPILVEKTPWDSEQRVPPASSSLFLVTIAIDDYPKSSGYDSLHSSVTSSKALVEAFSKVDPQPGGLFSFVDDRFWDGNATRAGILGEFESLAQRVHESDTVVIYFSGHGSVPAGQDMFYFVPIDGKGGSVSALRDTAISTAQIAEAVRAIRANRLLIVLDACQSGAVLDSLSKVIDLKAIEEMGMAEMSAKDGESNSNHGVGVYLIASATPFNNTEMTVNRASDLAFGLVEALGSDSAVKGLVWVKSIVESTEHELLAKQSTSSAPVVRKVGFDFPLGSRESRVH